MWLIIVRFVYVKANCFPRIIAKLCHVFLSQGSFDVVNRSSNGASCEYKALRGIDEDRRLIYFMVLANGGTFGLPRLVSALANFEHVVANDEVLDLKFIHHNQLEVVNKFKKLFFHIHSRQVCAIFRYASKHA